MTGILDLSALGDRKHETVTIPAWQDFTRDNGKKFVIVEWAASRAERWSWSMGLVLIKGGRITEDVLGMGMVGIAKEFLNAVMGTDIDPNALVPLLDELLDCVYTVRDPAHPEVITSLIPDADISEVKTRLWLRSEVLRVHTSFSIVDRLYELRSAVRSMSEPETSSAM